MWVFETFYPVEELQRAQGGFVPPISELPGDHRLGRMRRVVSLAAALAPPDRFPEWDVIVLLVFCTTLATLVLQGAMFGTLIRRLGIGEPEGRGSQAQNDRRLKEVAAAALDAISRTSARPAHKDVTHDFISEFKDQVENVGMADGDAEAATERQEAELNLRLTGITAAQDKLVERRDDLDGETLKTFVVEFDFPGGVAMAGWSRASPSHAEMLVSVTLP